MLGGSEMKTIHSFFQEVLVEPLLCAGLPSRHRFFIREKVSAFVEHMF